MARVDTVNELLRPMMGRPSVRFDPPRCAVCGSSLWCENHHPVRRGAGTAYDGSGRELSKPTVMLCKRCHMEAHANRLHFRWADATTETGSGAGADFFTGGGRWEFAAFEEPTKYQDALEEGAWMRMEGGAL